MSPEWKERMRKQLLAWFARHGRNLPWRQTTDPYAILVSEFLLQQTTVEAALPYFHRFLQKFPTLHDLAGASPNEVLEAWAGLGYYARARHLLETARRIVCHFQGKVPSDPETLQKLPGIGRYTAGAIASIAFGRKVPALDTNAIRVLARLLGWKGNPKQAAFQKRLWEVAADLLPDDAPGAFNQALMDLAALVCLPEAPKCHACPLWELCAAFASGKPEQFPTSPQKRQWQERREVACVIWRDQWVLVGRRQEGWWEGLWECPRGQLSPHENPLTAAERLAHHAGLEVAVEAVLTTLNHTVLTYRIHLIAVRCRYLAGEARLSGYEPLCWVTLEEAQNLPCPAPQRELLAWLVTEQAYGRQGSLF